jgi:multidrug efflux pump subunit AcrA (membrane-fusion protein)
MYALVLSISPVYADGFESLSRAIKEADPQYQAELRSSRELQIQKNRLELERMQQQQQQRQQQKIDSQREQQRQQELQEQQDRQKRINQQALELQAKKNLAQSCLNDIDGDPQFKALKYKVALTKPAEATIPMLANHKKPTAKEIELIAIWGDKLNKCWPIEKEFYKSQPSEFYFSIANSAQNAQQSLMLNLYQKEITYGEFSSIKKRIAGYLENSFSQIDSILLSGDDAYSRANKIELDTIQNITMLIKSSK